MPKPSERSQHLWPRESEALRLFNEGHSNKEISMLMGIKLTTVSGYVSNLRRKGKIPLLPPDGPGRRIKEVGPYPSKTDRSAVLVNPPALGLIDTQPREAPVSNGTTQQAEPPAPRRRKTKEGVTITMVSIAKRLDDALHQHVHNGGRLAEWERWALVLTGEILGP